MRSGFVGLARRLGQRRTRLIAGFAALAGVAAIAAASHGQTNVGVLKVRLGGDVHQTRVVVELDRATRGRLISDGAAGPGVLLALSRIDVAGDMRGQGAGLVKTWRVSEVAGDARIQLDLAGPAQVKRRFLLPPGDGLMVYRYVIDLSSDTSEPPPASSARSVRTALRARVPAAVRVSLPAEPAKKVIVIDAGHGGKDPGANGQNAHEKDLTLAAARALRDRLERSGRYSVVLTRDTDAYVPLEARVRTARRANADLFISLHADSGPDSTIRGATVYTLSEQGADRAGRQVFEKANWISVDLPGADESVNRILLDLTQRQTRNRSATFAEILLDRIGDKVQLLRRSHRNAGFMVLLAPDVPAVLLEMGFITNPEDERTLLDAGRRTRLMDGVSAAIDAYFAQDAKLAER